MKEKKQSEEKKVFVLLVLKEFMEKEKGKGNSPSRDNLKMAQMEKHERRKSIDDTCGDPAEGVFCEMMGEEKHPKSRGQKGEQEDEVIGKNGITRDKKDWKGYQRLGKKVLREGKGSIVGEKNIGIKIILDV